MSYNKIYFNFYINRVLTGHGIFPKFQFDRFGKDANCICNNGITSIGHIIKYCCLWNNFRITYFGSNYTDKDIKELLEHRTSLFGVQLIVKNYFD